MPTRIYRPPGALSLRATLGPLRHGPADPTMRLGSKEAWRATRTPDGPATLHLQMVDGSVEAEAWGPGADRVLEHLPILLGHDDEPERFVAHHDCIRSAQRHNPGLRFCASGAIVEALVPTIIGQKVTSEQAHRSYARLVYRHGEPAPGPHEKLRLPPDPARLAQLPYFDFHPLGIERKRAIVIKEVCSRAVRMEQAAGMTPADALVRLQAIPGVGAWTAACVVQAALGDPDAVIVGDYHLPNIVAWNLAGEARADDVRMLELLEPYRGQRARAVRFLKSGPKPPAFGPKHRLRDIARH